MKLDEKIWKKMKSGNSDSMRKWFLFVFVAALERFEGKSVVDLSHLSLIVILVIPNRTNTNFCKRSNLCNF